MKFVDLNTQFDRYESEIRGAIDTVLASSAFINGPDIEALESELVAFCGAEHAIACASGTDALLLGLMAKDLEPGDEVIVPAFTFIATATMIALVKAVPIFVDVDERSFNVTVEAIEKKISPRTKGIIPVSLYGQCPDMDEINALANRHGLWVMEDAAQSFGAQYKARRSCNLSELATTSFFPAKPLGCYGDGGAVFTKDERLAEKLRVLRNHGQVKRYSHALIGINGRMDTIQAAILRVKLRHFQDEVEKRQLVASRYDELIRESLGDRVRLPIVQSDRDSTWAQYTIRIENRNHIRSVLADQGIPTAVHYPVPLARQEAFSYLKKTQDYPIADCLSQEVLSLPMHAFLTESEQRQVVNALQGQICG